MNVLRPLRLTDGQDASVPPRGGPRKRPGRGSGSIEVPLETAILVLGLCEQIVQGRPCSTSRESDWNEPGQRPLYQLASATECLSERILPRRSGKPWARGGRSMSSCVLASPLTGLDQETDSSDGTEAVAPVPRNGVSWLGSRYYGPWSVRWLRDKDRKPFSSGHRYPIDPRIRVWEGGGASDGSGTNVTVSHTQASGKDIRSDRPSLLPKGSSIILLLTPSIQPSTRP